MTMEFSKMGRALAGGSGIGELMEDLGKAMAADGMRMLGGGQPALIPEVDAVWRRRMEEIMARPGELERMLSIYDPPRGNGAFLRALAGLLRRKYGWDVGPENLAVTAGGQTAFFYLFNLLAGEMEDGSWRKILLPLVPEYIGYANQGASGQLFRAVRPEIEMGEGREFKYRVDFDHLELDGDIAAVCVSRPTNPTGNVLTDGEMARLAALTKQRGIPLIVDNAYGAPFPNILFTDVKPVWEEHMILTMSLSKLGLPGTRTAVVVARPEIAAAVGELSSVIGLANPNMGQAIATPLLEDGSILRLADEVVRPFYRSKAVMAREWVKESFGDRFEYYVHRSEGALFLWMWFPGLPGGSKELYRRLKQRGVLVVPGDYFFYGLEDGDWPHRHECIRVSYAMDDETVRDGIRVIGEVVAELMGGGAG